jgi:heat shock protein HslJ
MTAPLRHPMRAILGVALAACLVGCRDRSLPSGGSKVVTGPNALANTAWRLRSLGGTPVLDSVEASIKFSQAVRVAGKGSCNHFFGTMKIAGDTISIARLGSTRMACPEAVMNQESKFLKALENAERFGVEDTTLSIYAKGLDQPLRFTRIRS